MTAHMLPPTVAFFIPNEPAKTRFCLRCESGSFTYYTEIEGNPQQVKSNVIDIADWTLTFTVNLSMDVIQTPPDDLAKEITLPGAYSINQLLLDFSTADLVHFDHELNSTPGITTPLVQDSRRDDALSRLISTYLREQVPLTHCVLGYAIIVPDPAKTNPIASSFPPTSVRFQTMAHQPISPGNDCIIIFLEMTDNHEFPTQPYIGWTSNRISEEKLDSRHAGCMVISKENIWDKFYSVP